MSRKRNTGRAGLSGEEYKAIVAAYLAQLEELKARRQPLIANWSQLEKQLGYNRSTIRKIVERYLLEQGETIETSPSSPPSPDEEWMVAFMDWAKGAAQPIPERVRTLFGIPKERPELTPSAVGPTITAPTGYRKCAFLSDIHIPYHDRASLAVALNFISDYKPDLIILGGDIFDCYDISDHAKDPDRQKTLQDEFDEGREFIKAVDGISSAIVYLEGNHEERLKRLIAQNRGLFKLRSLDFPVAAGLPERWRFYPDQTHYRLGKLLVLHGNLKGRGGAVKHAAANMLGKLRTSCIFGHWHRFGTYYETDYEGTTRAGFANGHLCDVVEARYIRSPDWQCGFSTIELASDYSHFAVQQHLIIAGRLLACGKEYTL